MKRFVAIVLLLLGSFSLCAQQWEINYNDTLIGSAVANGLTIQDGSTILVGGRPITYHEQNNRSVPMIIQVSEDGTYSLCCYWELYPGLFYDIVALNNGNFFAVGMVCDTVNHLYNAFLTALLDSDMNLIAANRFDLDPFFSEINSVTAEMDCDSTIVMLGDCYSPSKTEYRPCFFRFGQDGNLLNQRWVNTTTGPERYFGSFKITQLKCHPSNGYLAILCNWKAGGLGIFVYDHNFNYVSDGRFGGTSDSMYGYEASSDLWLSDEELLAWTQRSSSQDNIGKIHLAIARLKTDGTSSQFEVVCHRQDTTEQTYCQRGVGMAFSNDSTIYAIYLSYHYLGVDGRTGICLFNKDMEVLSDKLFLENENYNYYPVMVSPTENGGCVLVMSIPGYETHLKILKFSREDFNPIPCSVSKIPQEQLEALAFPNPASDEIHFDISGLPTGKEHRISISDAMGRTVMSRIIRGEGNVLTINISSLKNGIYYYSITNANQTISGGKFLKE